MNLHTRLIDIAARTKNCTEFMKKAEEVTPVGIRSHLLEWYVDFESEWRLKKREIGID